MVNKSDNPRILIIGPAWVGDMVMAQSLFIHLKNQMPSASIDVLAPDWTRPLLERMPQVSHAISMPITHNQFQLSERYAIGKQLRACQYDQAIILPNSWKSGLIPLFAKIPTRTGWLGEYRWGMLNDARHLDKEKYPLMIERFIALGSDDGDALPDPLPHPSFAINRKNVAEVKAKFELLTDRPILALSPGAEFGPSKRWPEDHYIEAAKQHLAQGWSVWLFGSSKDREITDKIEAELANCTGECFNLSGETSLGEAIDLLSCANLVISNDSGLMHIAAALNRPLVVVYGSTSQKFTPPLSNNVQVVSLDLECSPCFKRACPLEHGNCLKQLTPDYVMNAIGKLAL